MLFLDLSFAFFSVLRVSVVNTSYHGPCLRPNHQIIPMVAVF